MDELLLIGIGTGNPDHLTREAIQAIRSANAIIIPRKGDGKSDLVDLRRFLCTEIAGVEAGRIVEFDLPVRDASGVYLDGVNDWHDAIARVWRDTVADITPAPKSVALLVWGDPSLYDSTLRIAARLSPKPKLSVVAGITSLQALTAAHAIPLNGLGVPFVVTTGRQLREHGWPEGAQRAAIMLDQGGAFDVLNGEDFDIWWGAFLGMPNQVLIAGRLNEVAERILETRATARAEHGWIMDTYLLNKRS